MSRWASSKVTNSTFQESLRAKFVAAERLAMNEVNRLEQVLTTMKEENAELRQQLLQHKLWGVSMDEVPRAKTKPPAHSDSLSPPRTLTLPVIKSSSCCIPDHAAKHTRSFTSTQLNIPMPTLLRTTNSGDDGFSCTSSKPGLRRQPSKRSGSEIHSPQSTSQSDLRVRSYSPDKAGTSKTGGLIAQDDVEEAEEENQSEDSLPALPSMELKELVESTSDDLLDSNYSGGTSRAPTATWAKMATLAAKRPQDFEPPCFELLPFWTLGHESAEGRKAASLSGLHSAQLGYLLLDSKDKEDITDAPRGPCCSRLLQRMMLAPASWSCTAWDLMSMFFICYEMVVLPLRIFDLPDTAPMIAMEWSQLIFWTISIPRCFIVGYLRRDGTEEMRPDCVARNYLRGWFPFDLVATSFDWAEVILFTEDAAFVGAARLLKAARISRILRVVRLLRMFKMPAIVMEIDARVFSERTVLLLGIVKMLFLFAFIGHVIACLWYGLGVVAAGTAQNTWVEFYGISGESLSYRYFTSLHFALTQFVGSMDVQPKNSLERGFTCGVLVLSFVCSAGLVSRITASMTRLQIIAGSHEGKFAMLRQYLRNQKVSTKLAMRVMRSAQNALQMQAKSASEQDVDLLSIISEPLRIAVHWEIFGPILSTHPLFAHFRSADPAALRELCHVGARLTALHAGDLIFVAGEAPRVPRMFFLARGHLTYTLPYEQTQLVPGHWASEAALWVQWAHVGDLTADVDSMVVELDAESLQRTMHKFQGQCSCTTTYAQSYVTHLNASWAAIRDVSNGFEEGTSVQEAVWKDKGESGTKKRRGSASNFLDGVAQLGKSIQRRCPASVVPVVEDASKEFTHVTKAAS